MAIGAADGFDSRERVPEESPYSIFMQIVDLIKHSAAPMAVMEELSAFVRLTLTALPVHSAQSRLTRVGSPTTRTGSFCNGGDGESGEFLLPQSAIKTALRRRSAAGRG